MSGRKKTPQKNGSPKDDDDSPRSTIMRSPGRQQITHEPSDNSPSFTSVFVPQGRIKCVTTFTVMPGMFNMLGRSSEEIQDPVTLVANRYGRLVRESDIDYCYITVF